MKFRSLALIKGKKILFENEANAENVSLNNKKCNTTQHEEVCEQEYLMIQLSFRSQNPRGKDSIVLSVGKVIQL